MNLDQVADWVATYITYQIEACALSLLALATFAAVSWTQRKKHGHR